jgi:hypothetical protein
MVPKLHAKRTHFQGTAQYLLHDISGKTTERVAWTEVRNVASRNPEVVWRVMAATSMDQDRLKQQSGVKNTGRKSKEHALHFSLAWHPEERDKLNRQEMMRAVNTVLRVMGAQEHQCLVVAHKDGGAPHCHVLLNRVHPRDGRLLSSSFEKLKASRWAEAYEKERGKIYCEQRVINNGARERGEFTRAEKDQPRQVHQLAKAASHNQSLQFKLLAQHRRQSALLKAAERKINQRHKEALQSLSEKYLRLRKSIDNKTRDVIGRNKIQIQAMFRPRWEGLYHRQQAEVRDFEQREQLFIGRMKNILQAVDFKALLRADPMKNKTSRLGDLFRLASNVGARRETLNRQHERAKTALARQQNRLVHRALQARKGERAKLLAEIRTTFLAERSTALLAQEMDKAKLKAQWLKKGRELRDNIHRLRSARPHSQTLTPAFTQVANCHDKQQSQGEKQRETLPRERTQAPDLLPKVGRDQAAEFIDRWKRILHKRQERDRDQDNDRGRSR